MQSLLNKSDETPTITKAIREIENQKNNEDKPFKVREVDSIIEPIIKTLMRRLLESLRNEPEKWKFVLIEGGYQIQSEKIYIGVSIFFVFLFHSYERIRIGFFGALRLRIAAMRWKKAQKKNLAQEENDARARLALLALGARTPCPKCKKTFIGDHAENLCGGEHNGFTLAHTEE